MFECTQVARYINSTVAPIMGVSSGGGEKADLPRIHTVHT